MITEATADLLKLVDGLEKRVADLEHRLSNPEPDRTGAAASPRNRPVSTGTARAGATANKGKASS
jgi:hypothetical protein